jgi:hypothetical protein
MGTLNNVLSSIQYAAQPDITLRNYQHASKIFSPNNNSLAPKTKNWFHIYFQMNPAVITQVNQMLSQAVSNDRINWKASNLPVLGVLAKSIILPKIKLDTVKNNQYNRWSLTQTKINYEPISVSFWDDTINVIQHFWYGYYQYMNQDPNFVNWAAKQSQGINIPSQWSQSNGNVSSLYNDSFFNYGLDTIPTTTNGSPLAFAPGISFNRSNNFFESIRIYQFNRAVNSGGVEYTEFALVNPVITGFSHDDLESSSSEFMINKMDIEYETVFYNNGYLNNDEIASWDAVTATLFDNTPSPLGSTNPLLNTISQVATTTESAVATVQAITSNPGGVTTVATVLSEAGQVSSLTNAAGQLINNGSLTVPTPANTFGDSGLPPLSVGV